MVRHVSIIFCVFFLFLTACVPDLDKDDDTKQLVEQDEQGEQKKEVEITPELETTKQEYRTVVEFEEGVARGHILYGVKNRLDIDELGTGLMRLSKAHFSPDKYVYQDGQYLDSGTIESWLEPQSEDNPAGMNPPRPDPKDYKDLSKKEKQKFFQTYFEKHPSYLSYIVEQNYLLQGKDDQLNLGGVSLAISMNKVFSYQIKDENDRQYDGQVDLDPKKVNHAAKEAAESIVQQVREIDHLREVPLMIALYQEQTVESLVPGHFFAKTVVDAGDDTIGDWEALEEQYFLFPSKEAKDTHRGDYDKFQQFKTQIEEYFPNFIGVVGKGFYKNNELQHLNIEIPIKFYSQTEVISFTQYVAGLVAKQNPFQEEIPLDVTISSAEGPEAVIVREANDEEPFVYIY